MKLSVLQSIRHADRLATLRVARCRGIRRIHLNTNMPTREQAPGSQFGSDVHGSLLRAERKKR